MATNGSAKTKSKMANNLIFSGSLPLCPSVNHYWGHRLVTARHRKPFVQKYLTDSAKKFRAYVMAKHATRDTYDKPVHLDVVICFATNHKQDLDNRIKGLQDALVHAGVIADDSLVHKLSVSRGDNKKGGEMLVTMWGIE